MSAESNRPHPKSRSVELPAEIVARVEKRLAHTEFSTSGEYVTYVLEEVLSHVEDATDEEFETVSEEEVQDRLRSLGYMES
ncbi:hypothetical protein [Haloprofundus halobius]|uniref:hypothetical protein n=1 Tax=Haloprofundus halobius TaxID=2876194 RepID=UPI001CCB566D|nr:hypothetical protein [Haloprofundus halobius]